MEVLACGIVVLDSCEMLLCGAKCTVSCAVMSTMVELTVFVVHVYNDTSDVRWSAHCTLECQHWLLNASTFVSNAGFKIIVLEFLRLFCS